MAVDKNTVAAWKRQPAFGILCDLIAEGRSVVVTGAGVSHGMVRKSDGQTIGGWCHTLLEVKSELESVGALQNGRDDREFDDLDALLTAKSSGEELIEGATILKSVASRFKSGLFFQIVKKVLSPAPWISQPNSMQTKLTCLHDAILSARPRGIMTFNVDRAHMDALKRRRAFGQWLHLDPTRTPEDKFREWVAGVDERPFLLEAHGSVKSRIVFAHDEYRELLTQVPSFGAFMQNLLTNFSFLVTGYGLSDLDFDQFLNTAAMQFGEPIRRHVRIEKSNARQGSKRREVHLRNRYGFYVFNVKKYEEIPVALELASKTAGPLINGLISECLSPDTDTRRVAHHGLRKLGEAGQTIALNELLAIASSRRALHEKVEAIFSLQYLRSRGRLNESDRIARDRLLEFLENSHNTEILAHAALGIRPFISPSDLPRLRRIHRRLTQPSLRLRIPSGFPDPNNRVPVYVRSLILQMESQ